ncbi:MAG TPA: SRPBCC family protein [Casimicrobiaceae bacterium]|jgi:hypothetical protein
MTIAIVVIALIAAFLLYAAMRPNEFRVHRSARINAAPDKIFPHIADFHEWVNWSPYERLDPAMKKTHSGAPSGKGAIYEWDGNSKAGQGRMEIVDVTAPRNLTVDLHFVRPFRAHNAAEFTLDQKPEGTDVTWSMRGPAPFMHKVMSVFINMDRMIGKDFEAGLATLKSIAER